MKEEPAVPKGIREEEIRAAARVEELRRRGRGDVRAALTRSLLMTGVCALIILALALASDSLSSSSPGGSPIERLHRILTTISTWFDSDERAFGLLGILTAIMFPAAVLLGEVGTITNRFVEPIADREAKDLADTDHGGVDWRRFSAYDRLAYPTFISLVLVSALAYLSAWVLVGGGKTITAFLSVGIGVFATMLTVRAELDLDSSPTLGTALRRFEILATWHSLSSQRGAPRARLLALEAAPLLLGAAGIAVMEGREGGIGAGLASAAIQSALWAPLILIAERKEPLLLFSSRSDFASRVMTLVGLWFAAGLVLIFSSPLSTVDEGVVMIAAPLIACLLLILLPLWHAVLKGHGAWRGVNDPLGWLKRMHADASALDERAGRRSTGIISWACAPLLIGILVFGGGLLVSSQPNPDALLVAWNASMWMLLGRSALRDERWASGALRAGRLIACFGALAAAARLMGHFGPTPTAILLIVLLLAPAFVFEAASARLRLGAPNPAGPVARASAETRLARLVGLLPLRLEQDLRASRANAVRRLNDALAGGGLALGELVEFESSKSGEESDQLD